MLVADVDPADEFTRRYTGWRSAVSRAVGFEFASALTGESPHPEFADLVARQRVQNGQLLMGLLYAGRN